MLEIDFSINFKLGTTVENTTLILQLQNLYSNFQGKYHQFVSLTLEHVARNIASTFSIEDFFSKRLITQQIILDQLTQELEPRFISIT